MRHGKTGGVFYRFFSFPPKLFCNEFYSAGFGRSVPAKTEGENV
jgi:hypothetical protein